MKSTGTIRHRRRFRPVIAALALGASVGVIALAPARAPGGEGGTKPIGTTVDDFFQPGTQPDPAYAGGSVDIDPIVTANTCSICHGGFSDVTAPYDTWINSIMGQTARDPLFHACLAIAKQDAGAVAEFCIRCHIPNAWLADNLDPPADANGIVGSLSPIELQGVSCDFCHRVVDPVFKAGISPAEDESILAPLEAANLIPPQGSNSRYIIDPTESRRGPFDDLPFNPHFTGDVVFSPHHITSDLCWTCHDVSNPIVSRQENGDYLLNDLAAPHPTHDQFEMFPLHRTYSEWQNSYYFTAGGVQHNGRFGGNHINNPEFIKNGNAGVMVTCQDCHLPDQAGFGCNVGGFPERQDVPQHSFLGANNWVIAAVLDMYGEASGLTTESVAAGIARNVGMLEAASDLQVTQQLDTLNVRVINQSGHKLPTGFPDGRRIWVNVKFFDADDVLISEFGAYDFATAELDADSTKVYEVLLGITEEQAALVARPAGETFNFMLANEILKDNRIPSQGYSPIVAAQKQMEPVGATYIAGQHWDDTAYTIPPRSDHAVVTVYYQLNSKAFIEFLLNENTTDSTGQSAYDQWVLHGMSPPVVMDMLELDLGPIGTNPFDLSGDGVVGPADLAQLLAAWGPCSKKPKTPCPADYDKDGTVGPGDLGTLLANWGE
jgi:hypothetical protein